MLLSSRVEVISKLRVRHVSAHEQMNMYSLVGSSQCTLFPQIPD
jgi:hypothetical protein